VNYRAVSLHGDIAKRIKSTCTERAFTTIKSSRHEWSWVRVVFVEIESLWIDYMVIVIKLPQCERILRVLA